MARINCKRGHALTPDTITIRKGGYAQCDACNREAEKERRSRTRKAKETATVGIFHKLLALEGLPEPVEEYRFHPVRKWRFDYAFVEHKLALEVEGGVWTGGRHTRGAGFLADCAKYNAASVLGWRLLRVTPSTLATMETVELIRQALSHSEAA